MRWRSRWSSADRVWLYQGPNVSWDVAGSVAALGERAAVARDLDQLVATLGDDARQPAITC